MRRLEAHMKKQKDFRKKGEEYMKSYHKSYKKYLGGGKKSKEFF